MFTSNNKWFLRLTAFALLIACSIVSLASLPVHADSPIRVKAKHTVETSVRNSALSLVSSNSAPSSTDINSLQSETSQIEMSKQKALKPTIDGICYKLRTHSNTYITLSEEEMTVLRTFMKQELSDRDPNWWTLYPVNGKLLSTYGICKYGKYMFFICDNRKILFSDPESEKTVAILNPLDYPIEYDKTIGEYQQGKPYGLHISSDSSYIFVQNQDKLQVEQWEFDKNVHTWKGTGFEFNNTFDKTPTVVLWNDNYHFFIVGGNLLCLQEGNEEIKLLATNVSLQNIATVKWSENTLYYSCSNELHMLNINTLEDVTLVQSLTSGPMEVTGITSYAVYHNIYGQKCLVFGYFDDDNQRVVSPIKVDFKIREYETEAMERIKELAESPIC